LAGWYRAGAAGLLSGPASWQWVRAPRT
jgi:hypothetical protein